MKHNGKQLIPITKKELGSLTRKVRGKKQVDIANDIAVAQENEAKRIAKQLKEQATWPVVHGKPFNPKELDAICKELWERKDNEFKHITKEQILRMIQKSPKPKGKCPATGCKDGVVFKGNGVYANCKVCNGEGLV